MGHCDLSISMGGYNTCMNVLAGSAGPRAPVHGRDNTSRLRAQRFERLGLLRLLDPSAAPDRLAAAIRGALGSRARRYVDLNGVATDRRSTSCWNAPRDRRAGIGSRGCPRRSPSATRRARAVAQRGERVEVFSRDDDVAVEAVAARPARRDPVNRAGQSPGDPAQLDDAGADLLKDTKRHHWDLIGLNQHGWARQSQPRQSTDGPARGYDSSATTSLESQAAGETLPGCFPPCSPRRGTGAG
jgi:hypothetical protein